VSRRTAGFLGVGLALCLLLAGFASYYASAAPDGLEKVAADQGFLDTAQSHQAQGPLAGYSWHGVVDARLSGGLAGTVGVLLTFLLAGALFALLGRHRKADSEPAEHAAAEPAFTEGDRLP
jgi:cobalt/nickel transport protein